MQKDSDDVAPSATNNQLPAALVERLDGEHLDAQSHESTHESMRVSTVDEDGWPHGAQLSAGECLALNQTQLLIATWSNSTTTRNLARDGRLVISVAHDKALLEIRGTAHLKSENETKLRLSFFLVDILSVTEHRSAYADVVSGLTFELHNHNRDETLNRWKEQIVALKAVAVQAGLRMTGG